MQKTILAVDDDRSALIFVAQVLRAEGYRVLVASRGAEALAVMAGTVPDLAILDVDMPEMDGLALLGEMRKDEVLDKVPVMFLTVKDGVSDETRGLKAGVVDYIGKGVLTSDRVDVLKLRVRNFFALQENEWLRGVLATIVSASHEINNPMTVVLGSAELLKLKHWVADEAEAQVAVDRVIEAARRIRTVMGRIATLTKVEMKPYLDRVEMLDLGEG